MLGSKQPHSTCFKALSTPQAKHDGCAYSYTLNKTSTPKHQHTIPPRCQQATQTNITKIMRLLKGCSDNMLWA